LVELRSQLETERADQEEIEAELLPAKAKFYSGRHSFREIHTRRGHNSQPAPSQTQKIKNRLGGLGSHVKNYRKWKQENYYRYDLTGGSEAAIVVIKED
jgi:hypothetical protein